MKMASPGGAFGVRRPGRFEVPDLPWDDVGHRQGLRDRLDEAVGEDLAVDARDPESVLDRRVIDDLRSGELVDTGVERGGVRRADEVAAAEAGADELRNAVALILVSLAGGGALGARGAARQVPPTRPAPGSLPFMGGRSLLTEAEKASMMEQLRREKMNNLLRGGRLPLPWWLNR